MVDILFFVDFSLHSPIFVFFAEKFLSMILCFSDKCGMIALFLLSHNANNQTFFFILFFFLQVKMERHRKKNQIEKGSVNLDS
jgi:hypothetical protein